MRAVTTSEGETEIAYSGNNFYQISRDFVVLPTEGVTWDDLNLPTEVCNKIKRVLGTKAFPKPFGGNLMIAGLNGAGKTFLTRFLASEYQDRTFYLAQLSALFSKWNNGLGSWKCVITAAKAEGRAVVIIENDSLGDTDYEKQVKDAILAEMQNMTPGINFIYITSEPWEETPMWTRRFPNIIPVHLPSKESRLSIITKQLPAHHQLSKQNIESIAEQTENFSPADLLVLIRDAQMEPIRNLLTVTKWKKVNVIENNKVKEMYVPCKEGEECDVEGSWHGLDIVTPVLEFEHITKTLARTKPTNTKTYIAEFIKFCTYLDS